MTSLAVTIPAGATAAAIAISIARPPPTKQVSNKVFIVMRILPNDRLFFDLIGEAVFVLEDLFYRLVKKPGDLERQWQAGIIFLFFNGYYGLPGYSQLSRKVFLRPVIFGPQHA